MTVLTKPEATAALDAAGVSWTAPAADIVDALTPAVTARLDAADDSDGIAAVEAAVADMLVWAT